MARGRPRYDLLGKALDQIDSVMNGAVPRARRAALSALRRPFWVPGVNPSELRDPLLVCWTTHSGGLSPDWLEMRQRDGKPDVRFRSDASFQVGSSRRLSHRCRCD